MARNFGLKNATGDYIWFVDGDDLIKENIIEDIVHNIKFVSKYPDILFADYQWFDDDRKNDWVLPVASGELTTLSMDEVLSKLWGRCIYGAVWNMLFNLKFLKETKILFDETLFCNEDEDFLIAIVMKTKKIDVFHDFIYQYRTNNLQSITHDKNKLEKFKSKYKVYIKWYDYFFYCYQKGTGQTHMLKYIALAYNNSVHEISQMNVINRREAIELFKQRRYIGLINDREKT